jgi:hypothetical protein
MSGGLDARYSVGVMPTMCRKVRLKVPRLVKPTSRHTSVTLRSVSRSRNIERSTRRRWRYRWGVSPKTARKLRMKWAGEQWATAATAGMSSGSA